MKTDCIILDVDGTLWDSAEVVARAWTRAMHSGGYEDMTVTADMLRPLFGHPVGVITYLLMPQTDEKMREYITKICCRYEQQELEEDESDLCYPGVVRTAKNMLSAL